MSFYAVRPIFYAVPIFCLLFIALPANGVAQEPSEMALIQAEEDAEGLAISSGAKRVTGQDLHQTFNGTKQRWDAKKWEGLAWYETDGAARAQWPGGTAEGTWHINENEEKFCTKWRNIRDGETTCYSVYLMPDGRRINFYEDGSYSSTDTTVEQ